MAKQETKNRTFDQQFVLPNFKVVRTSVSAEEQRRLQGGEVDETQMINADGSPKKKVTKPIAYVRETIVPRFFKKR